MNYNGLPAIITTLSITMLAATIMISYTALPTEATKSDTLIDSCYVSAFPEDRWVCFPNHEECNKAQSSDLFISNSCFKHKS